MTVADRRTALVGTYTSGTASRGVYLISWDAAASAAAIDVACVVDCDDPSYVLVHPRLPLAYVVNERPTGLGGLTLLRLPTAASPRITIDGQWTLQGELPCHLAFTREQRGVVICHYGTGAVEWLGLASDGRPSGERRLAVHVGHGSDRQRQASAHAHSTCVVGADIYVADLGIDAIVHYAEPEPGASPTWQGRARYPLHAGAGPRTLVSTTQANALLVSNELDNSVSLLQRSVDGALREHCHVSALPAGYAARSACAELHVDPRGRYALVANRGQDAIATLPLTNLSAPDGRAAVLPPVAFAAVGKHPRHFLPTPDGRALLVASRDDAGLQVFDLSPDGVMRPRGAAATPVPAPVCLAWCEVLWG